MQTLVAVKPLENYKLWLRYADGVEGILDMSAYVGKGVFAAWTDPAEFMRARVGPGGEVAWSDQIEMDADALYLRLTDQRPEDIFPALRETIGHAGD